MPQPKEELYTVDYIYTLPEDTRVELLDGVIYNMAPPSRIHQEIIVQLVVQIESAIKRNNGECKVYPAPFGVTLDENTYVEPDISVICDKNKLTDAGCNGVPELIMEVVSPSSVRNDYILKLDKYIAAGIFEYWIVDPMKKQIFVYSKKDNYVPTSYKITDTIEISIIRNCKIDLKSLF